VRALVIAPYLPFPPDHGGKIRLFELVRRLARRHEVTLAALLESEDERANIPALEALGVRVLAAARPQVRMDKASKLRRLFSPRPRLIGENTSQGLAALIEAYVRETPPDIIQCEQFHVARYAAPYDGIPRLLAEQNIEYSIMEQIARARPAWTSRIAGRLDALKLRRFEQRCWRSFDAIAAVSTEEESVVQRWVPGGSTAVIPNGVDTAFYEPSGRAPAPGALIITGTVGYYPNLDGIRWFLRDIFPLVKQEHPEATLHVVGQLNEYAEKAIGRPDSVVLTGRVPDVRPYVMQSQVFVVPLRIGGGTRLKVLEAMAQGIPIVSTSIGCEGIEVEDGKHLLIADSPGEFAGAIDSLLRDPALRDRVCANARRLVVDSYDWESIARKLEGVYERLGDVA
jgi:sugar transferase (PEP-CTERM/EpsH1 system associated)